MGRINRQLLSLPGFLVWRSSDNHKPLYHTLCLEKPKTLSTIAASLTKLKYKMLPILSYPKKTIAMLATLPNVTGLTNSVSSQPKIAILATLPNVMVLPNSVSSPTNELEKLNKIPTNDDTEGHLPSWNNFIAITFTVILAVLFLKTVLKALRAIYESISIPADSICTLNEAMQDEEAYYKQSESEYIPRAFVPLVHTAHAIHWLRTKSIQKIVMAITGLLTYLFQPLNVHTISFEKRGIRAFPSKLLLTSYVMLREEWYKWVTKGAPPVHSSLNVWKHLTNPTSKSESWTRLNPFSPQCRRPPDPLNRLPAIFQQTKYATRNVNYIIQSTASFLCTHTLRITTTVLTLLTRPLRSKVGRLISFTACAILCRLPQNPTTDAIANNQPKYFDLNKLTQAVHELHIIEPQHERSSDENAKLLAYLTALISADIKNKGKAVFDPGGEYVCVDTGASSTIWNFLKDFISLEKIDNLMINGIASGLKVEGVGVLKFTIMDTEENTLDVIIRDALYVPNAPMCLLCPHQLAHQTGKEGDGFNSLAHHGILTIEGFSSIIQYDRHNNLPIFRTQLPHPKAFDLSTAPAVPAIALVSEGENVEHGVPEVEEEYKSQRLSKNQKTLLRYHRRCGHLHMEKLQQLAKDGILPKCIADCEVTFCDSCQVGKQHLKRVPHIAQGHLDTYHLKPGDEVSYKAGI
jgi:hypothetical protein